MKIQFNNIVEKSKADGPGERVVLFVQGCSLACPGCQSPHLWPALLGKAEEVRDVANRIMKLVSPDKFVTLSGGEIMQQPEAIAELIWTLRQRGAQHIIAYTGYRWEEMHNPSHPARPWLKEILSGLDILVDGRFIKAQDDPFIMWRGSRNQRPINVPATLAAGKIITHDWDAPRALIGPDGTIVVSEGMARELAGKALGQIRRTRICGEAQAETEK